jgi:hypothetical protein
MSRSAGMSLAVGNATEEIPMKLTRIIFIALAVLLPTTWTIAQANEEAPAEGKKEKKAKKGKKAEKEEGAPAEGGK